ncbi:MAG TPA: SDR family NAD(P)-dependent oxidoreductase [Bacteroidales bacterium]|nr:SDR family NAD(P)-dependent oxidoreductase [Bacteroidales bacterium]HRR92734.1 SDR family NAD(P)-dependent oxidoreductase [Bacteroidales bacterium]HRT88582.1 SDR family NAD(P)-dependent oxidoreductase [Bacteroidales bacterium]
MKNIFKGKTVWITGASSGIGEALVYALSGMGATVVASANDAGGLTGVGEKCLMKQTPIKCVPFDLSDTSTFRDLAAKVFEETGRIDYLFNIGGISHRSRIDETPLELDRKIMDINYFGTIALTKAVLPYMKKQGGGYILATSSISGRFGFPLRAAYSASKQALHGFFETLYIENKKDNIKVSVIIPGRVRTNISINSLDAEGKPRGVMDPGQMKGVTPEKAAKTILRGVAANRREILVGKSELIMLYIRKYLPWLFFRIAGRIKPY